MTASSRCARVLLPVWASLPHLPALQKDESWLCVLQVEARLAVEDPVLFSEYRSVSRQPPPCALGRRGQWQHHAASTQTI